MAASSVAEPATCLPLPDSPSSQSPPPPPPTASGLELQDPLSSDREHEQLGVLLSPNKSQRTPDFLPPRMLQALKQQQQQQLQWDKEQSTSPRRLQQSPKKDSEVCFVRSSFLLFTIFSPSPTVFIFSFSFSSSVVYHQ